MKLHAEVNRDVSPLSKRENDILVLMAEGLTRPAIADFIHRSKHTIDNHFNHIFQKLDADNSSQAITISFMRGILSASKQLCLMLAVVSAVNCVVPGKAYAGDGNDESHDAPFVRVRRGGRRGVNVRGGNQLQLRSPAREVR